MQTQPLSAPTIAAFATLTLALASLWLPRASQSPRADRAWMLPGLLALVLSLIGGLTDAIGLLILLSFAAACFVASHAASRPLGVIAHAVMVAIGAGLFLHVMPGFDNPRVLTGVVLGPDAAPYTKYLNFDKGMAGLFLLGLYAPDRLASDEGARHLAATALRFVIVVTVVLALTLTLGYVRWDLKLPAWWPLWLWSMVFLTALPEEAAFRGVAQTRIARRLGDTPRASAIAVVTAGLLFGLAHIGGGPVYAILASVAGAGYGWVYASSRSLSAAIATHAGLNTIHLFCFTYPSLLSM